MRKEEKKDDDLPKPLSDYDQQVLKTQRTKKKLHLKFLNLGPSQRNLSPTSWCFQHLTSKCLNLTKTQV
jgi:hypothetical protein